MFSQKGSILLIGIVAGLIIAAISFGLYYFIPRDSQPTPTATTVSSKSYSNSTYKFSVEYPSDWALVQYEPEGSIPGFKPLGDENYNQPYYSAVKIREGCPSSLLGNKPFEEWIKVDSAQEVQGYQGPKSIEEVTTKAGVKYYKIVWNTIIPGGGKGEATVGYIKLPASINGYNCLEFEYGDSKYNSVADEIVSSFKFTN